MLASHCLLCWQPRSHHTLQKTVQPIVMTKRAISRGARERGGVTKTRDDEANDPANASERDEVSDNLAEVFTPSSPAKARAPPGPASGIPPEIAAAAAAFAEAIKKYPSLAALMPGGTAPPAESGENAEATDVATASAFRAGSRPLRLRNREPPAAPPTATHEGAAEGAAAPDARARAGGRAAVAAPAASAYPETRPHNPMSNPAETHALAQVMLSEAQQQQTETAADQQRWIEWLYNKETGVVHPDVVACARYMLRAINHDGIEALSTWIGNAYCGAIAIKQHKEFLGCLDIAAKRELSTFIDNLSAGKYDDRPVLVVRVGGEDGLFQRYVADVLAWPAIVRGLLLQAGRYNPDDTFLRGIVQFVHGVQAVLKARLKVTGWCGVHLAVATRNHGVAPQLGPLDAMMAAAAANRGRARPRDEGAQNAGPTPPAAPAASKAVKAPATSTSPPPQFKKPHKHRGGRGKGGQPAPAQPSS
jgi:hypothetical protein